MSILCDTVDEFLGQIGGILLEPDTCKVAGFFVMGHGRGAGTPFLLAHDITRWGVHVHVRDPEAVYPIEERIRLEPLFHEQRRVLGQRIQTESGRTVGVCKDVQLNTESMRCDWLFPRRFFRWGPPIAIADIVEVTPQAIIVRDPPETVKEREPAITAAEIVSKLPDIAATPET